MTTTIQQNAKTILFLFVTTSSVFLPQNANADVLRTVALSDRQAPGTSVGTLLGGSFGIPTLNDSGKTAFTGLLTGAGVDGTNARVIWSEGGNNGLSMVARAGGTIPDTDSDTLYYYYSFDSSSVLLSNNGRITFLASVDGTNDRAILHEESSGGLALVAREGNIAPGTSNATFGRFIGLPSGGSAFLSVLAGPGVNSTNDYGIWQDGTSGLSLIAREGNAAPGAGSGVVFRSLGNPVLSESGKIAFQGQVTGTGVGTNNVGIWKSRAQNDLSLLVRLNDNAPGTTGVIFRSFSQPTLNNSGDVAFAAGVNGVGVSNPNNSGIWSEGPGNGLSLIARAGDQAPGVESNINFASFEAPLLNRAC